MTYLQVMIRSVRAPDYSRHSPLSYCSADVSRRYHSIHKNDLARDMVAHSKQAFLALAQGTGPAAPTLKILEYNETEPFFVAGDRDTP